MADEQEELELEDAIQGEYIVPDEDLTEETAETTEVPETTEETQEPEEETTETSQPAEKEVETTGPYAGWTRDQIELQLDRETKANNRAQAELRTTLKEQAAQKTEGSLTKDQLIGILREHKDDPEAQFQVYDYMASEHAKKAESNTIDAMKVSQVKAVTDQYVASKFPELRDESSANYAQFQDLKSQLGLANNPHADYIVGNLVLGLNSEKAINEQYNRGLNEGQGKAVEKNRKKGIKEGKLESSTTNGKSTPVIPSNLEDNARILGLTGGAKDDYFKMMKNKGGA